MAQRFLLILAAGVALAIVLSGCPGRKPEIIEQKCSTCHSTTIVYEKKRTVDEWGRLVHGMKERGLQLTPDEEKQVLGALAKYCSPD